MLSLLHCALAFLPAAPSSASQGDVLVVGPGAIDQIQTAVNLAHDGDAILVRVPPQGAAFAAVSILGKGVTITADSRGGVPRVASLQVRNVPAGKTVVLSRLALQPSSASGNLVESNAGH